MRAPGGAFTGGRSDTFRPVILYIALKSMHCSTVAMREAQDRAKPLGDEVTSGSLKTDTNGY